MVAGGQLLRPHHSAQVALQRLHYADACPHSPVPDATRYGNLRAGPHSVPQKLEEGSARSTPRSACLVIHGSGGSEQFSPRRTSTAMEECAVTGGPLWLQSWL